MISSSAYALYDTSSNEVEVDADLVRAFTPIAAPSHETLKYPFSFIDTLFDLEEMTTGILDEESCSAGNFPKNITEYYYVREGFNDGDAWECLCKLDNGCYAFYTASCDYTGFDCQGGMDLIVSKDREKLFYQGITQAQRYRILSSGTEGDSDSDSDSDSHPDCHTDTDSDTDPYPNFKLDLGCLDTDSDSDSDTDSEED